MANSSSTNEAASGFTPGPWAIAPETNGTELVAYSANPWRVRSVICRGSFVVDPNWAANTRLIAAAPELLAACEDALQALLSARAYILDRTGTANPAREEAIKNSRAAIAKARGQ